MMKIKIKSWHIILVLFLSIISYFLFCFNILAGKKGFSGNINKAKKLGVFVGEFAINKDSILINGSDYLTFGEIWLEKYWSEGRHHWDVHIDEAKSKNYTLYFELTKSNPNIRKYLYEKNEIGIIDTSGRFLGMIVIGESKFFLTLIHKFNYFEKSIKLFIVKPNLSRKYVTKYFWNNRIVIDSFYVIKK
ncbi:MAG TPA: hypothetical protein VK250_05155 [Nitrososphaeraceae archaeon]|nr:hypothetical protein [Nitrososphaeraceae archaeon]